MAHILVVEDEPDNIDLVRLVLEEAGHHVTGFFTAEEALSRAAVESYDLVLMDLALNGVVDGIEAVRRLRSLPAYARCPIVALTAFSSPSIHERARRAGCDEIVTKPIQDLADFIASVDRYLSGASVVG